MNTVDRRQRKPDPLLRMLRITASLGWLAILTLQIVMWQAAPEVEFGLVKYHGVDVRSYWEPSWVKYVPFLLAACTLMSLTALGVTPFRSRRKNDPKRVHLLILLGLTVAGYALYWFQILS